MSQKWKFYATFSENFQKGFVSPVVLFPVPLAYDRKTIKRERECKNVNKTAI